MKTRRGTRKEGQSSPHFVLRNKTEHLNYTRRRRSKYESEKIYQNIFKTRSRRSRKNLDQFLLRYSFVNHPTVTVKIWEFLF